MGALLLKHLSCSFHPKSLNFIRSHGRLEESGVSGFEDAGGEPYVDDLCLIDKPILRLHFEIRSVVTFMKLA